MLLDDRTQVNTAPPVTTVGGASLRTRMGRRIDWLGSLLLERAGYVLAALPIFTDFIDTGRWPEHPRELVTEIVLGLIILLGVALLYRRVDRLKTLAETDPLTGLGNRLRFRGDLDAATLIARESGQPLTLALIDLNDFKRINDHCGHDMGDECLQAVARALERSVRQGIDGCYRLGGDEFALLIQGHGTRVLDTLQRSFGGTEVGNHLQVTFSVGVASSVGLLEPGRLLKQADALMYAAKRGEQPPVGSNFIHGIVSNQPSNRQH